MSLGSFAIKDRAQLILALVMQVWAPCDWMLTFTARAKLHWSDVRLPKVFTFASASHKRLLRNPRNFFFSWYHRPAKSLLKNSKLDELVVVVRYKTLAGERHCLVFCFMSCFSSVSVKHYPNTMSPLASQLTDTETNLLRFATPSRSLVSLNE